MGYSVLSPKLPLLHPTPSRGPPPPTLARKRSLLYLTNCRTLSYGTAVKNLLSGVRQLGVQIQVLPFTSHTTFGKSFHLVQTQFHRLSVGMVTLPPSRVSWGLEDNRGQAPGIPSAQDKQDHQPFMSHEFCRHTLSMAIVATMIVFSWYFSLT